MDELERNDAQDEQAESAGLAAIIEEVQEAQDESEATDNPQKSQSAKPIKGAGFWAWLVAGLVMFFGLFMLIPAALNTALGSYALLGLLHETGGDYESAIAVYFMGIENDIEAWAVDNFSFGNSPAPGFTTMDFGLARYLGIIGRQAGPLDFSQDRELVRLLDMFERVPRSLKSLAAQVEIIAGLFAAAEELAWELEAQPSIEQELQLLESLRAQDEQAGRNKLVYDAVALLWLAIDDLFSEEVAARLEALKSARGSELWMYDAVASALETNLPLEEAKQLYHAGNYDQAIALCEALIAEDNSTAQRMNATAIQGIALMLRGDIRQAYELLSDAVESNLGEPNAMLYYAAVTAAIAADEFGFVDFIVPPSQREAMPPELEALIAGETTLEAIFLPDQAEHDEEEAQA